MGIQRLVRFALIALILTFALTGLTAYGESAGPSATARAKVKRTFQIHFLNQGRVDAILIVSNGEAMFIDSGYRDDGLQCIDSMKRMGITKLRYYIGTHAHKDHIGGAAPIIYRMRPEQVFIPHDGVKAAIIKYAAKGAERQAVESARYTVLCPGDSFRWNGLTFACLGPLKVKKCSPGSLTENYNSLVLRINRGSRPMVLLTGDTSAGILSEIERKHPGSIRAEVLKNPHHNGAQPESILRKISPKIVAICNSSLPSGTYRKRIQKIGSMFYTACLNGSGTFMLEDFGGKWIATEESAAAALNQGI